MVRVAARSSIVRVINLRVDFETKEMLRDPRSTGPRHEVSVSTTAIRIGERPRKILANTVILVILVRDQKIGRINLESRPKRSSSRLDSFAASRRKSCLWDLWKLRGKNGWARALSEGKTRMVDVTEIW